MRDFGVACRYLTILPFPGRDGPGSLGRAAGWFPAVGALVGSLLALAWVAVTPLLPPLVAAVLVVGLWAGLTGGLHLDGLADTLDGLGGGFGRDRALAIMRDPRTGPFGVAGIVLALTLKAAAIATMSRNLTWRALILAPTLGRLGPPWLARLCPAARAEGAGHAFALTVPERGVALATGVAVAVAGLLATWWGLALAGAAVADAAAFAVYLRRRLGGLTGDCLGALVEGSEAGALVLITALAQLEVIG